MANREVNLTKRVQTPHGLRYCRVAALCQWPRQARCRRRQRQGRATPRRCVLPGMARKRQAGTPVGGQGCSRCRRASAAQRSRAQCAEQWRRPWCRDGNGHRSLAAAVTDFLDETKLTKKPKTIRRTHGARTYFLESCPKLNVEDVERKDLLKFSAFLRDEKDQAPRSVYNKFENVMTFLKAQGYPRPSRQERLAAIRRGRTGGVRERRTRHAVRKV